MNCLTKIITLILLFSFLWVGTALATIEKDTTKRKTDKRSQNITPGDSTNDTGFKPDAGVKVKRPPGYDDFVDKNNNGIDDRVEQKMDSHKKNSSPGISESNLLKRPNQNSDTNRRQRSPDDSVVKFKNR